jgi:hypothetical protein
MTAETTDTRYPKPENSDLHHAGTAGLKNGGLQTVVCEFVGAEC